MNRRQAVVLGRCDRLSHAGHRLSGNFGWEGPKPERRIARVVVAEVRVVECIYQIHSEVNFSSSFITGEGPGKVLRERKVEKLLPRWSNIQRARGIAQSSLYRSHKRSRINERFATSHGSGSSDRAIARPQGILQWHARHDVWSHNSIEKHTAKLVRVSDDG